MRGILLLFFCFAGLAAAQFTNGYVFLAPGAESVGGDTSNNYGIGGGIDRRLIGLLGVNAEIEGIIGSKGKANTSMGVASFDASVHFPSSGKAQFFVVGGYSVFFNNFTANGVNGGLGLNYELGYRKALRLEFRLQHANVPATLTTATLTTSSLIGANFYAGRIGFTFGPTGKRSR